MTIFHSQDGLYFAKGEQGQVHIVKRKPEYYQFDVNGASLFFEDSYLFKVTLTDSEFASVVASMSAFGETNESYTQALKFLQGIK